MGNVSFALADGPLSFKAPEMPMPAAGGAIARLQGALRERFDLTNRLWAQSEHRTSRGEKGGANALNPACIADFQKKFPVWSTDDLQSLRDTFICFDINSDGLIDFDELSIALDQLGDESPRDERLKYFAKVDVDHSNCIDLSEFLELIDNVVHGPDRNESFASAYVGKIMATSRCHHIPLCQQISGGIL